ncbi:hypothetical protein GQ457_14G020490 [Hibiscus cannabinus]
MPKGISKEKKIQRALPLLYSRGFQRGGGEEEETSSFKLKPLELKLRVGDFEYFLVLMSIEDVEMVTVL